MFDSYRKVITIFLHQLIRMFSFVISSRIKTSFLVFSAQSIIIVLTVLCNAFREREYDFGYDCTATMRHLSTTTQRGAARRIGTTAVLFMKQCPRGITRNKKTG